jgi:hypothetical protein
MDDNDPQKQFVKEREENDSESNESETAKTVIGVDDQDTEDLIRDKDPELGPKELRIDEETGQS